MSDSTAYARSAQGAHVATLQCQGGTNQRSQYVEVNRLICGGKKNMKIYNSSYQISNLGTHFINGCSCI